MRKLLTLLFSFFAIHSFAQIPVQRTTTTTPIDNYLKVRNLLTLPNLGDTITFSGSNGLDSLGSIIYVKSGANKGLWLRDTLNGAHTWVKQQYSGASTISKLNDSTLLICNSSSCDTIVVSVAAQPIQNWTVLSDTSIQVCNGSNVCDTVYTNPIYYAQTGVDSVTVGVGNTAVKDTVNWYKDGIKHQAGLLGKEIQTGLPLYVQYNSDSSTATIRILQADGIISGCQVTWSGTGFTYNISPCVAQINDSVYSAPQNTVTLPNPDPTYPTSYVFIIDTTATTGYIAGTPSPSAPVPQTQYYQLPLTSAITLNPGDTIPPNINYNKVIYDEGLGTSGGEWNTSSAGTITYDTLDISNPYHLSHDIYVSTYFYSDMYFTAASPQTYSGNGDVLTFHIYTNGNFKNKNNIYLAFANDTTNVTNFLLLSSSYGFNKNNGNIYQTISVPLSAFNWSATTYNRLTLVTTGSDNTGTAGYFLDYITLQSGTPNITPPTDYSNKVDSSGTYKINDSTYVTKYWVKGISYVIGDTIHIISSGGGGGGSVNSVTGNPSGLVDNTDPANPVVQQDALKLNISDTASMLSPYLPKKDTTNSITGYTTLYQNSLKSAYVPSITSLENYTGNSNTVIVQDSWRGGTFNYVASATPDSGTVFPRYGGGYWKRQYSGAVNADWYGGITTAIQVIGSNKKSLIISSPQTLTGNVFISYNIALKIENNAAITIPSGDTLTIKGPMSAGRYQIFSGSGIVVFGYGSGSAAIKEQYPEWDGAYSDNSHSTETTHAFSVEIQRGVPISLCTTCIYSVDSIPSPSSPNITTSIIGDVGGSISAHPTIFLTATSHVGIQIGVGAYNDKTILSNFTLQGNSSNIGGIQIGDATSRAAFYKFDNLKITGFTGIGAYGINIVKSQEGDINNCDIRGNYDNIYKDSTGYCTSTKIHGFKGYIGLATHRGVNLKGSVTSFHLENIVIESNAYEGVYNSYHNNYLYIEGCHIENNLTSGGLAQITSIATGGLIVNSNNFSTGIPEIYLDSTNAVVFGNLDLSGVGAVTYLHGANVTYVDTKSLTVSDGSVPTTLSAASLTFQNKIPSGGWAKYFANLTDSSGNKSFVYGAYGSAQSLNYGFIGAGSGTDYLSNNIRFYPDRTVGLVTVNDAIGTGMLMWSSSTNKVTYRTQSEIKTDLGVVTTYKDYVDNRSIKPNDVPVHNLQFGFGTWGNNNSSPYADYIHLGGYTDGSGGKQNLVVFRKDSIGMRIYQAASQDTNPYSSYRDVLFKDQLLFPNIPAGAIANGTTATTQATTDSSQKLATTAFTKQLFASDTSLFYTAKGIKSDTTLNPGYTTLILDSAYVDSTVRSIAAKLPETPHQSNIIADSTGLVITNTFNWYNTLNISANYHLLSIRLPTNSSSGGSLKNGYYEEFVFNKNIDSVVFNDGAPAFPASMKIRAGDYVKFVYSSSDSTWHGGGSSGINTVPVLSKATDPTTADIINGSSAIYKNTTSGLVYLWTNISGTLFKTQLN